MNIIEKMREILQSFPKISQVCNEIHIDFADPEPTSYGLDPIGDELISEDILGNQKRQHNFMLYATYSGINDYERMANSGVLLELTHWLHNQIGAEIISTIDAVERRGEITKITANNAMLYQIPQENTADGLQYQLSIQVQYSVEM
ncbi:MAG: hypothetical protein IJO29_01600 [Oscillospiraceae bacterium]|nr:hypothetical protein [Oscillospiraceae bacterium]